MIRDTRQRNLLEAYSLILLQKASVIKNQLNPDGEVIAIMEIPAGAIGYGYDRIFGPFVNDPKITVIQIEEPYLLAKHQIENFVCLIEYLLLKCPSLKEIKLTTGTKQLEFNSYQFFDKFERQLAQHGVVFTMNKTYLHDRVIRFNSGFVFEIGYGLDYFDRVQRSAIEHFDFNFRTCKKTRVKISYVKSIGQ